MVLDTGDVTSWGTEAESAILAPIGRLDVPYVFVAGNHDSTLTAQTVANFSNAVVLNNEVRSEERRVGKECRARGWLIRGNERWMCTRWTRMRKTMTKSLP